MILQNRNFRGKQRGGVTTILAHDVNVPGKFSARFAIHASFPFCGRKVRNSALSQDPKIPHFPIEKCGMPHKKCGIPFQDFSMLVDLCGSHCIAQIFEGKCGEGAGKVRNSAQSVRDKSAEFHTKSAE